MSNAVSNAVSKELVDDVLAAAELLRMTDDGGSPDDDDGDGDDDGGDTDVLSPDLGGEA